VVALPEKRYALYLGCAITGHQPYVEAAIRKVAKNLNVELVDVEGATCCPDPEITKSVDHKLWLIIAARNLALAEKTGANEGLLVICNGCYDTFKKAIEELEDKNIREEVNKNLLQIGLAYRGEVKLVNVLEFFRENLDSILELKKKDLDGLKCVVQYGCRLLTEQRLVKAFDEILEALGVEIVRYERERMCCGVPLMYYDEKYALRERTFKKLEQIARLNPDFITLVCPACHDQLERGELKFRLKGKRLNIPVINLTELVAVALGENPKSIGMNYHRVKPLRLIKKLEGGT